jgi:hypothetical protein
MADFGRMFRLGKLQFDRVGFQGEVARTMMKTADGVGISLIRSTPHVRKNRVQFVRMISLTNQKYMLSRSGHAKQDRTCIPTTSLPPSSA